MVFENIFNFLILVQYFYKNFNSNNCEKYKNVTFLHIQCLYECEINHDKIAKLGFQILLSIFLRKLQNKCELNYF